MEWIGLRERERVEPTSGNSGTGLSHIRPQFCWCWVRRAHTCTSCSRPVADSRPRPRPPPPPPPPLQVDLLPLTAANRDHLAQYAMMDVSLDPWPYAGTTTTTESLYMGAWGGGGAWGMRSCHRGWVPWVQEEGDCGEMCREG